MEAPPCRRAKTASQEQHCVGGLNDSIVKNAHTQGITTVTLCSMIQSYWRLCQVGVNPPPQKPLIPPAYGSRWYHPNHQTIATRPIAERSDQGSFTEWHKLGTIPHRRHPQNEQKYTPHTNKVSTVYTHSHHNQQTYSFYLPEKRHAEHWYCIEEVQTELPIPFTRIHEASKYNVHTATITTTFDINTDPAPYPTNSMNHQKWTDAQQRKAEKVVLAEMIEELQAQAG